LGRSSSGEEGPGREQRERKSQKGRDRGKEVVERRGLAGRGKANSFPGQEFVDAGAKQESRGLAKKKIECARKEGGHYDSEEKEERNLCRSTCNLT